MSLWPKLCWHFMALRGYDLLHASEIVPREAAFRLVHWLVLPVPARLDELSEQHRRRQPVGWRGCGWRHFERSCLWGKRGGCGRRSCGRHRRLCCRWQPGRRSDGPVFWNRRGRGRWQRGGRRKFCRLHARRWRRQRRARRNGWWHCGRRRNWQWDDWRGRDRGEWGQRKHGQRWGRKLE
jgi:hypothetical protein